MTFTVFLGSLTVLMLLGMPMALATRWRWSSSIPEIGSEPNATMISPCRRPARSAGEPSVICFASDDDPP